MIKSDVQFTHCVTTHHQINERKANTPSSYTALCLIQKSTKIFLVRFIFQKQKLNRILDLFPKATVHKQVNKLMIHPIASRKLINSVLPFTNILYSTSTQLQERCKHFSSKFEHTRTISQNCRIIIGNLMHSRYKKRISK